jgi:hypothetical protein
MQAEGLRRASWPGSPLDATALRRDISEAQAHIIGLQRRYSGRGVRAFQPVRQAR